jgi:hypothetical protein
MFGGASAPEFFCIGGSADPEFWPPDGTAFPFVVPGEADVGAFGPCTALLAELSALANEWIGVPGAPLGEDPSSIAVEIASNGLGAHADERATAEIGSGEPTFKSEDPAGKLRATVVWAAIGRLADTLAFAFPAFGGLTGTEIANTSLPDVVVSNTACSTAAAGCVPAC